MAVFHPRTRLDSFVEGALSPSSRARVSAHLADCADCRREVGQRERILRAATSLGQVAGLSTDRPAADGGGPGTVPVLERRDGVAGWKVVLCFGAAGLLTSGVLMTAWVAGDPEASGPDSGQSQLLSFAGDSSTIAGDSLPASGAEGGGSPDAPASGPSSGAVPVSPVPDGTPGATPADATDGGASSARAYLPPAGSILSSAAGITSDTAVRLTPSMVTGLRQAGWNVPTFHGLGMPRKSTGWQRGDGVAEVVVALSDGGRTLEFRECRPLRDAEPAPPCPVGADPRGGTAVVTPETTAAAVDALAEPGAGPVTGPMPWGGADVVRLPVGVDMRLREHADGSWTATLATDQAGYSVDSDLPVENAPRVMSMVVISERSRVQGGTAPESPGDRLARGFERLLPWTGVTEPQRQ
jgi:hypothetical protein